MPAYSRELTEFMGRTNVLQAVLDQVKNRHDSLAAQKKVMEDDDAFIDQKNITAVYHRMVELDLLVEALENWIHESNR